MMRSSYIFLFIFLIISPWKNLIFIAPSVDGKWQAHTVWIFTCMISRDDSAHMLYHLLGIYRSLLFRIKFFTRLHCITSILFHSSMVLASSTPHILLLWRVFLPLFSILLTNIICILSTFYAPQLLQHRADNLPHKLNPKPIKNTARAANNNNFTTIIIIIVINFDNVYNCFNRFSNVLKLLCCYMYYHLRASRQE